MSNGDLPMTNMKQVRAGSCAIAALLTLAGAVACDDKADFVNVAPSAQAAGRVVVAAGEVTFTHLNHTDISARLVLASSLTKLQQLDGAKDTVGDVTGLSARLVVTSEFPFEPADSAHARFIRATFALTNAGTGTPLFDPARHNLTFVAVVTPNTIAGTPVRLVLRADGTPASATIAQQLLSTDIMALTAEGTLTTIPPTVRVALPDSVLAAIPLPSDASRLLPFGFIVRGLADFNGLQGLTNPADGLPSFAFRLPKQALETDDASTLSVLFLLVNNTSATAGAVTP